ncbi:MAG: acetyl-CoA carboxylase biotin carboxyl carrier protein, partial [Sciscionella sp.]
PSRLRVRLADAAIELEWPDGTAGEPPSTGESTSTVDTRLAATTGKARHRICAPSIGTFYVAPEPGARPFVRPGDALRPGQQVAIVEAMKLMLPVEADRAGRVVEVLKADGATVEYGDPLFVLESVEAA